MQLVPSHLRPINDHKTAVQTASSIKAPWCVWLTDFGTKDSSVSELLGVMYSIYPDARIVHLSHDIAPFAINQAAWQLFQSFHYWPPHTHFVCVVDPEVGSQQASLWCESNTSHVFLAPDNGLLSLIDRHVGWKIVRSIDRSQHLASFHAGHTSYGRDLYAYVTARLLSGAITPKDLGPVFQSPLTTLLKSDPVWSGESVCGTVVLFDGYDNVWSDIPLSHDFHAIFQPGRRFRVKLTQGTVVKLDQIVRFETTYSSVAKGEWVLYLNSMNYLALAICCGHARHQLDLSLSQLELYVQWDERNALC